MTIHNVSCLGKIGQYQYFLVEKKNHPIWKITVYNFVQFVHVYLNLACNYVLQLGLGKRF